MDKKNRIVVLIDMDCFYCQVEEKLNPELKGKPIAVVQYNPWQGGGIIAVNYVARALGVTRHMRGKEAKEKCPEIQLPSVPCHRGKADITKYRDAGKEVAMVLQKFTPLLERASIDEAYLDITEPVQQRLKSLNINTIPANMLPNTYALGYDNVEEFLSDVQTCGGDSIDFDQNHASMLLIGAVIVREIRAAVYEETGYRCSAGIAHNKILAKLVCGMNKPNKQTVLPKHCIDILYKTLPLKKVKHLGGKFGEFVCESLKINTMAELQKFSEKELQSKFDEKNGTWLYNIARGIDFEPVQAKFNPKSIGCCKNFKGKSALQTLDTLKKWLKDLGDEIEDRLEKDALENNRTPKQMVASYTTQLTDKRDISSSRSYNFSADDELCGELFSKKALDLIMDNSEGCKVKENETNRRLKAPITFLGISVGKFEDHSDSKKTKKILDYFSVGTSKEIEKGTNIDKGDTAKENLIHNEIAVVKSNEQNVGKEYILQKFFETSKKDQEEKTTSVINTGNNTEAIIESDLLKQESFFAKMLKGNSLNNNLGFSVNEVKCEPIIAESDVIKCGEDSNDTEYSGSTINNEINRSIALFEGDPQDVARVSNIRQLLNSTVDADNLLEKNTKSNDNLNRSDERKLANDKVETFDCSYCGKTFSLDMFEMHSDYHLALKIRDEERQTARETKHKNILDMPPKENKAQRNSSEMNCNKPENSIVNFLVKIDDNIVTEICSECGNKVALSKFAEHLDFHEAQKLSRELNRKTPLVKLNSVKRKKKQLSPLKKLKVPCKSIDSFFK